MASMLHGYSRFDEPEKLKALYKKPTVRSIDPDEISDSTKIRFYTVKYIFINDTTANRREAFIEKSFKGATINKYRLLFDTLPRTFEKMDILVISGNDVDRLSTFFKVNEPLFTYTPRIVLGNALTPHKRANLLNLGYDDVLNTKTCTPFEFRARALAIHQRCQLTKQSVDEDMMKDIISKSCNFSKMTNAQKRIIYSLIQAPGHFCNYNQLLSAASRSYHCVSNEHLRVLISEIRSNLKLGYTINTVYGEGYRLTSGLD